MFHVEVEPTSLCNTRCFHCPHETISRPMGKMDWETYQSIMDKILAHKSRISVQYAGMGEPLLNSLIFQFIRYVADRGAATYLTTNGAALTEKNVQGLIDAGLSQVTISFNGIYKLQYELMMGGLNFERAERYLIDTIRMVESTTLKVAANVSVTKQTESNLADIKRYLVDAGVEEIYFSKCHNRGGNLKNPHVCTTPPPPKADKRCDIFANTLFVAWTGDVLSCCHDLSGAAKIGNLVTEEFESILHRKHVISQKGVDFDICK